MASMLECEIKNPDILDWLCQQQDELAVSVEFTKQIGKDYSALPLHIQSMTKSSKKASSRNDDVVDLESNPSESDIYSLGKKRNYGSVSADGGFDEFPKDLASNSVKNNMTVGMKQPLRLIDDSNTLLVNNDIKGMWKRFNEVGFLYFRGLIERDTILSARELILDGLKKMNHITEDEQVLSSKGWTVDCTYGGVIGGSDKYSDGSTDAKWKKLCRDKKIGNVGGNIEIHRVLQMLQAGKEETMKMPCETHAFGHNFSFLRVKGPKEFTAEHADIFYFRNETEMFNGYDLKCYFPTNKEGKYCELCRKTSDISGVYRCEECHRSYHEKCLPSSVLSPTPPKRGFVWHCADCQPQHTFGTCWIPLGDIDVEEGVLALMPGSTDLPNFYDYIDNTQLPKSYFGHAKGRQWVTGPYTAGDVVFFDSRLIHCTSTNRRNNFRLSLDVRWDLAPLRKNVWTTDVGQFLTTYTKKVDTTVTTKPFAKSEVKKEKYVYKTSNVIDLNDSEDEDDNRNSSNKKNVPRKKHALPSSFQFGSMQSSNGGSSKRNTSSGESEVETKNLPSSFKAPPTNRNKRKQDNPVQRVFK